jgi:hypothetical protein
MFQPRARHSEDLWPILHNVSFRRRKQRDSSQPHDQVLEVVKIKGFDQKGIGHGLISVIDCVRF